MRKLIVDGHNLLNASPAHRELLARDHGTARDRLVHELASVAGGGWDVTVVFDGAGNPHADGEPVDSGGVTVVYSSAGVSADAVLETLAREARDAGEAVRVVTSDADAGRAVMGPSVIVTSAATFAAELAEAAERRREEGSADRGKATVGDNLSPSVRATLLRIRDARD